MRSLKILGCLLTYPTKELIVALPECLGLLEREQLIYRSCLGEIGKLIEWMRCRDIMDLQETYVDLFDRTPSLSLHLFEHVHGESRDRGQAMVSLSEVYLEAGLVINTEEMPDYLPLFLEYLSVVPAKEALKNLGEIANILGLLCERLKNRHSPYSVIFETLIASANCKPDKHVLEEALREATGRTSSFDEMDAAWAEQAAFENSLQTTGQGGCSKSTEMLARMNIPLDGKEIRS